MQEGSIQERFAQVCSAEVCSAEIGSAEVCSPQVCSSQGRVNIIRMILFPPLVPSFYTLFEDIKRFLVYHTAYFLIEALEGVSASSVFIIYQVWYTRERWRGAQFISLLKNGRKGGK